MTKIASPAYLAGMFPNFRPAPWKEIKETARQDEANFRLFVGHFHYVIRSQGFQEMLAGHGMALPPSDTLVLAKQAAEIFLDLAPRFPLVSTVLVQLYVRSLGALAGQEVNLIFPGRGAEEGVRIKKARFEPASSDDLRDKVVLVLHDGKKIEIFATWNQQFGVSYVDTQPRGKGTRLAAGIEVGPAPRRLCHPGEGTWSPMVINP